MKTQRIAVKIAVSLCVIGGLISCSNLPLIPDTQILQVDDLQLESVVRRHDQAVYTLVFESGAANCIQRWQQVLQQLPAEVNVFAYNRPGYCNSSDAATQRTSQNIVHELRLALHQQGLKPPYVLIGHSLGGLYMQQFARQYPDEVQGLVLVDAMYPGFLKSPEEFPLYTKVGMSIFLSNTVKQEVHLAHTSGLMIDALQNIDDKPIVRMFNQPTGATPIDFDFGVFNRDEKLLEKIWNMYPFAKIVVVDSSHQIQETSPELVLQAIQDVMQAHGPLQQDKGSKL